MSVKADSEADAVQILREGLPVRRVKQTKIASLSNIYLDEHGNINYSDCRAGSSLRCFSNRFKKVNVTELLEVRQGYNSDGLHEASKHYKFQEQAPETACFSIIYKHPRYVCKSVDFLVKDEQKAHLWVEALRRLMSVHSKNPMTFDEKLWIINNFRRADLNNNGEVAFDELWKLLKKLNLQLSEVYVRALFKNIISKKEKPGNSLNESEFMHLFEVLTDLPEYRNAIRLANDEGNETLDAAGVHRFLTEEQGFTSIDVRKAEAVIAFCETGEKNKLLSVNGFRRLLQSRWGNILKEDHESVFQDMDQPLSNYFINSSHNTYLTGLQVRGNATVEGYISALRKGARLLELDVFDGEHGEPSITHKRTFISSISLRNALKCISQYAFQLNPYPVILTLENHVSLVQQRVMAEIFTEILGDKLYVPPADAATKPLPSPKALKNKILLRGKTITTPASHSYISDNTKDEDENGDDDAKKKSPKSPIDPEFGRLIALPSVKLSTNLYEDIKQHPLNGSPSLSEGKVVSYLESGAPVYDYTATRLIKSYPKGIRQDSSNMNPIPSWLCGIQAVAMNMQTASEEMDLVKGLFTINGNVGYVLKPKVLLDGLDPRLDCDKAKTIMRLGIICGQYFPKPEAVHDIVDPFISIEVFGIPSDEFKVRTRAVRNNGFNPVWNENFTFFLYRPELAIIRFSVKDFDATSSNDFIGEFSVPISSIRPGYSHIRLNTGFEHSPDDAASILVRIEFDEEGQKQL